MSLCRISSQTLTRATNYKNACNVSNVVMFNWWQVTGKISLSFHGPACGAPEGIYSWIYLHDLKKKKFRSLTVALADKLFPFHWENIACNITSSVFLNMYLIIWSPELRLEAKTCLHFFNIYLSFDRKYSEDVIPWFSPLNNTLRYQTCYIRLLVLHFVHI